MRRSTEEEKDYAILSCRAFNERNQPEGGTALKRLQEVAVEKGNIFEASWKWERSAASVRSPKLSTRSAVSIGGICDPSGKKTLMGAPGERFPPVSYAEWRRRVESELTGESDFATALTSTGSEGFSVEPLFTSEHPEWPGSGKDDPSGFPGELPYTRGAESGGGEFRQREICQLYSNDDPIES